MRRGWIKLEIVVIDIGISMMTASHMLLLYSGSAPHAMYLTRICGNEWEKEGRGGGGL